MGLKKRTGYLRFLGCSHYLVLNVGMTLVACLPFGILEFHLPDSCICSHTIRVPSESSCAALVSAWFCAAVGSNTWMWWFHQFRCCHSQADLSFLLRISASELSCCCLSLVCMRGWIKSLSLGFGATFSTWCHEFFWEQWHSNGSSQWKLAINLCNFRCWWGLNFQLWAAGERSVETWNQWAPAHVLVSFFKKLQQVSCCYAGSWCGCLLSVVEAKKETPEKPIRTYLYSVLVCILCKMGQWTLGLLAVF